MNTEGLKTAIGTFVEDNKKKLDAFNLDLWNHPELSLEEHYACEQFMKILSEAGLDVTIPYAGLDTAFRAEFQGGKGEGPTVAIMAEYDALPGIGHGCGHNIIAAAALGAFLSLYSVKDELCGKVCLIGTPGEEAGGGKILMLENGGFADVDFSMMIHSSATKPYIARPARACTHMDVIFHGKPAHSANPRNGIDALSAARAALNLLDTMRPRMPDGANCNVVIPEAGTASNIICPKCVLSISVRGTTVSDLKEILDLLRRCADAADLVVGTTHEAISDPLYAERYSNWPMDEAFAANAKALGLEMILPPQGKNWGSSDSGNVSIAVPTIHEYIPVADGNLAGHTKEYAEVCRGEKALSNTRLAAKAMAMTTVDILASKELQEKIKASFKEQIPEEYQKEHGNWKKLFR